MDETNFTDPTTHAMRKAGQAGEYWRWHPYDHPGQGMTVDVHPSMECEVEGETTHCLLL